MENYVADVINGFYTSDEDVKSDSELQSWAEDIYTNGFPSYYGGKQGRDFPQEITSKEQLIKHCTVIMFTGKLPSILASTRSMASFPTGFIIIALSYRFSPKVRSSFNWFPAELPIRAVGSHY